MSAVHVLLCGCSYEWTAVTFFIFLRNCFRTSISSADVDSLFGVGSTLGVNANLIIPVFRGRGTGIGKCTAESIPVSMKYFSLLHLMNTVIQL